MSQAKIDRYHIRISFIGLLNLSRNKALLLSLLTVTVILPDLPIHQVHH